MKLTEEQIGKVVDHIQKIAPEGLRCPICGETKWSINNTIFQSMEFTGSRMQLGQGLAIMPFVVLSCNNCLNCIQFNALHLGIIDRDKYTIVKNNPDANSK